MILKYKFTKINIQICNTILPVVPPNGHYLPANAHKLLQIRHFISADCRLAPPQSVLLLEKNRWSCLFWKSWKEESWQVRSPEGRFKRRTCLLWWCHQYRRRRMYLLPDLRWYCGSVVSSWPCRRASFSREFNARGSRHRDTRRAGPSVKISTLS